MSLECGVEKGAPGEADWMALRVGFFFLFFKKKCFIVVFGKGILPVFYVELCVLLSLLLSGAVMLSL